jgi:hypothetical protein
MLAAYGKQKHICVVQEEPPMENLFFTDLLYCYTIFFIKLH